MFSAKQIQRMDSIRGFAALYVAFTHSHAVFNTRLKPLGGFGGEGVALFFLLSGLVVGGSVLRQKSPRWPRYFLHRTRRIWPPFLVSLLLAWVAQSAILGVCAPVHGKELLGNLGMLQGLLPGSVVLPYQQNWPLWSLAYEWWYYMLLPLIWMAPPKWRANLALAASCAAAVAFRVHPFGPLAYLGYWYLWWSGLEVAEEVRVTGKATLSGQTGNVVRLGLLVAFWIPGVVIALVHHDRLMPAEDPFLPFRHCAGGLVLLVGGLLWAKAGWRGFDSTLGLFARFAPVSYSVYLFHYPLFAIAAAKFPLIHESVRFLPVMGITLVLAWLVERILQPQVLRLTGALPSIGKKVNSGMEMSRPEG